MCELFGMSSRVPAVVNFSLEELAQHGDCSGPNREGWGIAYYEDRDARLIKEAGSANTSPLRRFIGQERVSSNFVIAHIRHATIGDLSLQNTHPFSRELGGRAHVFAHNGEVPGIFQDPKLHFDRSRPIGETDSEYAFCALLERLAAVWATGNVPPLEARLEVVTQFAADLAEIGAANFLYSDSVTLFAHSDRRRSSPSGPFRSPGLYTLVRTCSTEPSLLQSPGVQIAGSDQPQQVTLVASVPLTDEAWRPLPKGTIVALEHGQLVAESGNHPPTSKLNRTDH